MTLLLAIGALSVVGCGDPVIPPPPTEISPELEAQIKAEDKSVEDAEKAQR